MAGADTLWGGNGNDILNGGEDNDTMYGGDGDDTYIVDADDIVMEASGKGNDTVFAYRSYVLCPTMSRISSLPSRRAAMSSRAPGTLANNLRGTNRTEILVGLGGDDFRWRRRR